MAQRGRCGFRAPARCRSETGAPRRPRDSSRLAMRGFAAVRLAGGGVVGAGFALPRDAGRRPALHVPVLHAWWRTAERAKNKWQRTPFAAGEFGGKCERGDSPLSQKGNDQSELAAARRRRAREFRLPARSAGRLPDGAWTPLGEKTGTKSSVWPHPGTAWWVEPARSAGRLPDGAWTPLGEKTGTKSSVWPHPGTAWWVEPARSAGRTPDGAPTPSRTTTESYSGSWPRPGSARP